MITLPRAAALVKLAAAARLRGVVVCTAILGATALSGYGQTEERSTAEGRISAPQLDWSEAQAALRSAAGAKTPQAAEWLAAADKMRAIYIEHPDAAEAAEAKAQEALALIRAAELGGAIAPARITASVQAAKQESKLPEHTRFVVASRARELAIEQGPKLDFAGQLAAYEASARAMIEEFPARAEPYEALLAIARDQPDGKVAAKIARDLSASNETSEEIKSAANALLAREDLVGQKIDLAAFLGDKFQSESLRGKVIVLHSWAPTDENSMAMRGWLEQQASSRIEPVGVDLSAPSKEAASLRLSQPGMIYLIDDQGVLRDVLGRQGLQEKLAALAKEDAS